MNNDIYNANFDIMIVDIPEEYFIGVEGIGNPNDPNGDYVKGIRETCDVYEELCKRYSIDKTPVETLWWQEGYKDPTMEKMNFKVMIRVPECVKETDIPKGNVSLFKYRDGLCVQALHKGPFSKIFDTIAKMHEFLEGKGYIIDMESNRYHHEVYLSNPHECREEDLLTIVRHPIAKNPHFSK